MNTPLIVVIKDNLVDFVILSTKEECEKEFLAQLQTRVPWQEYTQEDIDAVLEQGYEITSNGSVCLTWV